MSIRVAISCSAEVEPVLRQSLQRDGDITVAARVPASITAQVPRSAEVLVVDIESAGGAALDFIAHVMSAAPLPILALCGANGSSPQAIEALVYGAVQSIPASAAVEAGGRLLRQHVHLVRGVAVVRRRPPRAAPLPVGGPGVVAAVAASTGGPAALVEMLGELPNLPAPVLLVQHLHDTFVASFVRWLSAHSPLPVAEATAREPILPGRVYVAPAGRHLLLAGDGTLVLTESPAAVHRPSADLLFRSVAEVAGRSAVGVLLTGMGADGAAGLLAMRRAGAVTVVQDEATCAVFGMSKAALDIGAADRALPPDGIAQAIRAAVDRAAR